MVFSCCLSVYVCIHFSLQMRGPVSMEGRGQCRVSSSIVLSESGAQGSSWAGQPQSCSCLHLPSTQITVMHCSEHWGSELGLSCLCGKHLTHWAISWACHLFPWRYRRQAFSLGGNKAENYWESVPEITLSMYWGQKHIPCHGSEFHCVVVPFSGPTAGS